MFVTGSLFLLLHAIKAGILEMTYRILYIYNCILCTSPPGTQAHVLTAYTREFRALHFIRAVSYTPGMWWFANRPSQLRRHVLRSHWAQCMRPSSGRRGPPRGTCRPWNGMIPLYANRRWTSTSDAWPWWPWLMLWPTGHFHQDG